MENIILRQKNKSYNLLKKHIKNKKKISDFVLKHLHVQMAIGIDYNITKLELKEDISTFTVETIDESIETVTIEKGKQPICTCSYFKTFQLPCACMVIPFNHLKKRRFLDPENLLPRWKLENHPLFSQASDEVKITSDSIAEHGFVIETNSVNLNTIPDKKKQHQIINSLQKEIQALAESSDDNFRLVYRELHSLKNKLYDSAIKKVLLKRKATKNDTINLAIR